ncbi:hypothetical protein Z949_474 [Sulfitobacter guttiformis KCTC 32187]|nr:hypothetical protein Z949_474 [Sulfitobacter guttiformis KCTC 32187]
MRIFFAAHPPISVLPTSIFKSSVLISTYRPSEKVALVHAIISRGSVPDGTDPRKSSNPLRGRMPRLSAYAADAVCTA